MRRIGRRRGAVIAAAIATVVLAGCGGRVSPFRLALSPVTPSPSHSTRAAVAAGSGDGSSTSPSSTSARSATAALRAAYHHVASGVVRIDAEDCKGSFAGTGFLLSHHLVATVAHVVFGRGAVRVISPVSGRVTTGRVVGLDNHRDLALVRTVGSLPGHVFHFSAIGPQMGSDVGAVGFAKGGPMALSVGRVTDLYQRITVHGARVTYHLINMVESRAAVWPGDSGGPWLGTDNDVVALSESGTDDPSEGGNDGVSSLYAGPEFDRWVAHPQRYAPGACAPKTSLDQAFVTLDDYVGNIKGADYASAYALFDPVNHPSSGRKAFIRKVAGTVFSAPHGYPFQVDSQGVSGADSYVDISYDGTQHRAGRSARCEHWTLRFRFTAGAGGAALIHTIEPQPGTHGHRGC